MSESAPPEKKPVTKRAPKAKITVEEDVPDVAPIDSITYNDNQGILLIRTDSTEFGKKSINHLIISNNHDWSYDPVLVCNQTQFILLKRLIEKAMSK